MTHELILADPAYSSWSLRAFLLVDKFAIPYEIRWTELYVDVSTADQIAAPPARTVPTLICDDGSVAFESIAIAEELATRHPDAGLWPANPELRALARSLTAEMHAGFMGLRTQCPMCLRTAYRDVPVDADLRGGLDRLHILWSHALRSSGGPWLAGEYSAADAFFAPIAMRIAGYSLPVDDTARIYVNRHLADPSFLKWRDLAAGRGPDLHEVQYKMPYKRAPFPTAI